MAVQLHYYGSVFDLAEDRDAEAWRASIAGYAAAARATDSPVYPWLPLVDGGLVSLTIHPDTPIAIVSR